MIENYKMKQSGTVYEEDIEDTDHDENPIDEDTPLENDNEVDKYVDPVQKFQKKFKRDDELHNPVYLYLKRIGSIDLLTKNDEITLSKRMHEGIDFHAPVGTEVYATANGVVKDVRSSQTFGKVIVIDHGYGLETVYAHLDAYNVRKGEKVKRGNLIAFVGNTGLSKGPHLHYEVHILHREVDPVNYFFKDLTPEEYREIVLISQSFEESMD